MSQCYNTLRQVRIKPNIKEQNEKNKTNSNIKVKNEKNKINIKDKNEQNKINSNIKEQNENKNEKILIVIDCLIVLFFFCWCGIF